MKRAYDPGSSPYAKKLQPEDQLESADASICSRQLLRDSAVTVHSAYTVLKDLQLSDETKIDRADLQKNAKPHDSIQNSGWTCLRLRILGVNQTSSEIVLTCEEESNARTRTVNLRGFWADSDVQSDDIVHVIGPNLPSNADLIVDDLAKLFLIVEPDSLLNGTTVSSAVFCRRKTVLNDRLKGFDSANKAMIVGSVLHDVFEQACLHETTDMEVLLKVAKEKVWSKYVQLALYDLQISSEVALTEIRKYIPQVNLWIKKYLVSKQTLAPNSGNGNTVDICSVKDIEESIWSPEFGLRGKVDVSLTVTVHEKKNGRSNPRPSPVVWPLELKTGKVTFSPEHRAQMAIYSLMMSSIYRRPVNGGLLLYLLDGSSDVVEPANQELSGIIQLRNELVKYLCESSLDGNVPFRLPPPINNKRACVKCAQLLPCAMYNRLYEPNLLPADHALLDLAQTALAHLAPEHLSYYARWQRWICLEWKSQLGRQSKMSGIWLKSADKREKLGCCLANMILDSCSQTETGFQATYKKASNETLPFGVFSVGDLLVVTNVSIRHVGLAMGCVTACNDHSVAIDVEKKLFSAPGDVFRLDKYESSNLIAVNLTYLTLLMNDQPRCAALRSLIIDKQKPVFRPTLINDVVSKGKKILASLNKEQARAVLRALMAEDYFLIQGMPGTGKTTTTAALVQLLCALGKTVLITAYTHSAVDNILMKLIKTDLNVLRLGKDHQINPSCQKYVVDCDETDFASMFHKFETTPVVACTCMHIMTHPLFKHRHFDYCLIDEATMTLQPITVPALIQCRKFILIGDPLQLTPIVNSKIAREEGMSETLFEALELHENAKLKLSMQYRMNSEIMQLSNACVYNGELKCANPSVENAVISLAGNATDLPYKMSSILLSDLKNSVIFLNTEKCSNSLSASDGPGLLKNPLEATLVVRCVQALLKAGQCPTTIGVIGVYRRQVEVIQSALKQECSLSSSELVEVNTADYFQGRDKDVIIVSFVFTGGTSKDAGNKSTSDLLSNMRRLNVILTRARRKLIFVGHREALSALEPMQKLFSVLRSDQLVDLTDSDCVN